MASARRCLMCSGMGTCESNGIYNVTAAHIMQPPMHGSFHASACDLYVLWKKNVYLKSHLELEFPRIFFEKLHASQNLYDTVPNKLVRFTQLNIRTEIYS